MVPNKARRYLIYLLDFAFFLFIFLITRIPLTDYDIWFHLKSGEIIAKLGVIHYDVFSYNTAGREWFPYEWLFQLLVYLFKQAFGLGAIPFLTALVTTILIFNIYFALRTFFNLNRILSYVTCFLFLVSVFEFISARPHVFAYTFLLINLNLILLYYIKNKNYLWATIPITIAWANLHGSIFLDIALFGAYAVLALINSLQLSVLGYRLSDSSRSVISQSVTDKLKTDNRKGWFNKFRVLGIYTVVTAICTILPPLYLTQYRLLWIFFTNNSFISKYIDEWVPLEANPNSFYFYSFTLLIILLSLAVTLWRSKNFKGIIWLIPLLIFPVSAYSASRNIFLGYITLALILGYVLSQIPITRLKKAYLVGLGVIFASVAIFHILILQGKMIRPNLYYPTQAAQFVKNYRLSGHMFNDYGVGGYLLYTLYPEQKVFYDGRTDLYLCCEMRDTFEIATKKDEPDEKYDNYLNWLWNRYKISYILLPTQKFSAMRKIGRLLTSDPSWKLVFWDDNTQIFVKDDGLNDNIIKEFGANVATPWNQNPYKTGMEDQAMTEYQKMVAVADSAKSRNAIGYILLREKKYDEAKQEFERALQVNPYNESSYMNLGELAAKDGNYDQAISLYETAKKIAPDRGLIYIRLGQLHIQAYNEVDLARQIWEEGLQNTIDESGRKQLTELLAQ